MEKTAYLPRRAGWKTLLLPTTVPTVENDWLHEKSYVPTMVLNSSLPGIVYTYHVVLRVHTNTTQPSWNRLLRVRQ